MLLPRLLTQRLPAPPSHRLVMITGARQTGKTTLARGAYPGLRYVTLDEIEERIRLRSIPTRAWASTVGAAILDEAQKEPALFEKVKFAFDKKGIDFTVLHGGLRSRLPGGLDCPRRADCADWLLRLAKIGAAD